MGLCGRQSGYRRVGHDFPELLRSGFPLSQDLFGFLALGCLEMLVNDGL